MWLADVFMSVVVELICVGLGFSLRWVIDFVRKRIANKYIKNFFGLSQRQIIICHTALPSSPHRPDIPLLDVQVANRLAYFLERSKIVTHHDIQILPYYEMLKTDGSIDEKFENCSLIIVGGPKHNKVADIMFQKADCLTYKMFI